MTHFVLTPLPPSDPSEKKPRKPQRQLSVEGCLRLFNLLDAGCLEAVNYFHGLRRIP